MFLKYVLKNRANLIVIFLCVASIALMGLFSYKSQINHLNTNLQGVVSNQNRLFQSIINADIEGLAKAHSGIDKLDQILKPFASGKKDELLVAVRPIFNEIRDKHNITHMYFIKPDGTVFLRVHKPDESGDKLSRITYLKAAKTKNIASGIEMGKNFFSLRSVKPIFYQGSLIGYLEIAEEIDHVFGHMKEISGNDAGVFLAEDFIKSHVTEAQGEKVGNFRLLYPTNRAAIIQLAAQLMPAMKNALKQPGVTIASTPEGKAVVGLSPFIDASGHTVGILFSHKNVSPLFSAMWQGVVTNVFMLSTIVITVLAVLFISLKKLNIELEQHAEALALSNSDLKRAEIGLRLRESKLESSERFLKTIIDTEPDCIKMLDIDGNLLMMNAAGLKIIQADSLEQVNGRCIFPLITEQYRDDFIELTKQVFQGVSGILEFEAVGLNGRSVWLETHAIPFRNEHGEIVSLLGISRDITDRKKSEKALQEGKDLLAEIIELSPISMAIVSMDGTIERINRRAIEIFGYTPEDIPNMERWWVQAYPDEIYRTEVVAQFMGLVGKAIAENSEIERREYRVTCKDGTVKTEIIFGIPVSGKIFVIFDDITERKQAEEDRIKFEKQLLQTQKMESLGIMAGGIAHDFNNLLQAILGNMELAAIALPPDSDSQQHIVQAMKSGKAAAHLASLMLAYAGKGHFAKKELNLSELVRGNIDMLKTTVGTAVSFELSLSAELPNILADEAQIQQIIMNLLTNAAESIIEPPGLVRLTTGIHNYDKDTLSGTLLDTVPEPGRYAFLEVSDNGCGMNAETLKRLFDPFFTTKFTGRGLGMSAVMGIIKAHGGALFVQSEPGEGTTFKVLIPVLESTPSIAANESITPPVALGVNTDKQLSGLALVVDDEKNVLRACKKMVELCGLRVITACDGVDAVSKFRNHAEELDIVLLDLTMPNMDGIAAMNEIYSIRPNVKILLVSGFNEEELEKRIIGHPPFGFIRKPYSMNVLETEVRRAMLAE